MSLSLSLLRQDLRDHLGVDSDDLDDVVVDRLLNRSWWAMSSEIGFNSKEAETTFLTVAGTDTYNIPVDSDAIQRVVIIGPDDEAVEALTKIPDWNMFAKEAPDERERPQYYSRRDDKFILYPIPDQEYTVSVKYLKTLADIEASGPDAPQEWHEIVLWGAVSRGFYLLGDWTRGKDAQAQQALLIQTIQTQNERETFDMPMLGLRVLKRRYP